MLLEELSKKNVWLNIDEIDMASVWIYIIASLVLNEYGNKSRLINL